MLDFLRHHWYDLGIISGLVATRYLYVNRHDISTLRKLLIASFITVTIHQVEEYRFPGGFPAAMNMGMQASDRPDRYPLSANSAFITNVLATYSFYLLPIFYPRAIWFGLAPMLFGFGQFVIHGIRMNMALHTLYNPGLASVILLHFPIGYQYIKHTMDTGLLTGRDWILGIVYAVAFGYLLLVRSTFGWLVNYDSPYPFTAAEMSRGGVAARLAAR